MSVECLLNVLRDNDEIMRLLLLPRYYLELFTLVILVLVLKNSTKSIINQP